MEMNQTRISLATVTPVYSGESYLELLVKELDKIRIKWLADKSPIALVEAIFVIDDAVDGSAEILEELARNHSWVTVIYLSRNYGQHPATLCGILHSSSDWVVTLDEDLQHSPNQIEALFKKVAEKHCDIVYAQPHKTVHENIIRDLGSRFYKMMIAKLTGESNVRFFNSFRLIRGSVARAASKVSSHDTYLDVALSWFSRRVACVEMSLKDERVIQGGKSGYSLKKLLSHARRMIVTTQVKALRIGAAIGLISIMISIFYGCYLLFARFFFDSIPGTRGWRSLMIAILFFGGITTFLLGILIEYFSTDHLHIQGKPAFFIVDRTKDFYLVEYFGGKQKSSSYREIHEK
jgi:glycosyltransferase involved in cell wall biosynthesis